MDPINVQLFKSDSGLPDEWLIKWTNANPSDSVRNDYYMAAYQNPATGVITLQYPYSDATYSSRTFNSALLLDEDGSLLVNKEWYLSSTSSNGGTDLKSTVPGAILDGELFTVSGPTYPYLISAQGNTGEGSVGCVTIGNTGLPYSYQNSQLVNCGGWAGPGSWPDDVAFVSTLNGNGNRVGTIPRDGSTGSYVSTTTFRADATLLWPDSDLYLQSRSSTTGAGIEFVAGSCDVTTHLPGAVDNRCFYYNGDIVTDRVVGYSYLPGTGAALFRVRIQASYYQLAMAAIYDPWGIASLRSNPYAYSFGYNTDSVSLYGATHCPDAYSSYQGLFIASIYSTNLGYQIVALDDYFVSSIAGWQYKVNAAAVPWYIYPDVTSDSHIIFTYKAGQTCYVMRLRVNSVVAGIGFSSAGVVASAPTNALLRYLGVEKNTNTPTGEYGSPVAGTYSSPAQGGITMGTPTGIVYQSETD
jgi:hypothetical protein